jgi:hypothetical protein
MERDRQTALTNSSTEWGRLIESKTYWTISGRNWGADSIGGATLRAQNTDYCDCSWEIWLIDANFLTPCFRMPILTTGRQSPRYHSV